MAADIAPPKQEAGSVKRLFLLTLLISLVVSAAIGIIAVLAQEFGPLQARMLATTLTISGFSLTGLACAARASQGLLRPLGWLGALVSLGGAVLALALIWELAEFKDDDLMGRMAVMAAVVAIAIAHLALLGPVATGNGAAALTKAGAMLAAVLLAALLCYGVWNAFEFVDTGLYFRLLAVTAILDALGTLSLGVVTRLAEAGGGKAKGAARSGGAKRPAAAPGRKR